MGMRELQETMWYFWCEYFGLEEDGRTRKTKPAVEPWGNKGGSGRGGNKVNKVAAGASGGVGGPASADRAKKPRGGDKYPQTEEGRRDPKNFSNGAEVVVRDLENARHHNGKHGWLKEYDAAKGRWGVLIEDKSKTPPSATLMLKPSNIELVPEEDRQRNGRGIDTPIESLTPEERRNPANFNLVDAVKISGLENAQDHNGRIGFLEKFDKVGGGFRYIRY